MQQLTTNNPIVIDGIEIDPIDYAIRANANLGIKETGKSYAAGFFAEQLMKRGIPITVISPSPGRVWRHLKIGRPGYDGFPVVIVGDDEDADLQLSRDTAADIMRAAMKEGISIVFDVFSKNLTKSDFRAIVKEVTQVLLFENENYGLRHLFLEEAGDLVPQKVYDKVTYAAVEQLIRVGGNSGVGVTILNPRAEGVNKEALELCQQLFLFKQTGRNSITNLGKWLQNVDAGNRSEVAQSLSKLQPGECWFWDATDHPPALLHIPQKDTIHPDRRSLVGKYTSTKVGTDVSSFVARLNKELQKQSKEKKSPFVAERQKRISTPAPAWADPRIKELESQIEDLRAENNDLQDQVRNASAEIEQLKGKLATVQEMLKPQYEQMKRIFNEIPVNGSMSVNRIDSSKYAHWFPKLVGYQKDMLEALIEHRHLTRDRLGLIIGKKVKGNGTFTEYVGVLRRMGLVREEGSELVLVEL